jgi:hypothetical protein
LIALTALKAGHTEVSLALITMSVCYLRPGELANIREEDLVEPLELGSPFALNLHPEKRSEVSKVGLSDETMLLDSPDYTDLGAMLAALLTGVPSRRLFGVELLQLTAMFATYRDACGLRDLGVVLYMLRHGGPSHDRRKKYRTVAEIKSRGRWASDSSLRRYEAHARVAQEFRRAPRPVQGAAKLTVLEILPLLKKAIRLQPTSRRGRALSGLAPASLASVQHSSKKEVAQKRSAPKAGGRLILPHYKVARTLRPA